MSLNNEYREIQEENINTSQSDIMMLNSSVSNTADVAISSADDSNNTVSVAISSADNWNNTADVAISSADNWNNTVDVFINSEQSNTELNWDDKSTW